MRVRGLFDLVLDLAAAVAVLFLAALAVRILSVTGSFS